MENQYLDQFNLFNNTAFEAAKELEAINTKLFEKLTQKNMDLFNSTIEANNKFVALFGEARGVQDLVTEQIKVTGEYNGKVITTIKEAARVVADSKDDYQAWFEGGIKAVSETAAVATPARSSRKKAA